MRVVVYVLTTVLVVVVVSGTVLVIVVLNGEAAKMIAATTTAVTAIAATRVGIPTAVLRPIPFLWLKCPFVINTFIRTGLTFMLGQLVWFGLVGSPASAAASVSSRRSAFMPIHRSGIMRQPVRP